MPTGLWKLSDAEELSPLESGYEHWFSSNFNEDEKSALLRAGHLILDLNVGDFDPTVRPSSLSDAVIYLVQLLATDLGTSVLPFVINDGQLTAIQRGFVEKLVQRNPSEVEFRGLPLQAKAPTSENPDPNFERMLARRDRIDRIVAVIDADIGFAHQRFRDDEGSRIAWFWDMDATAWASPPFFNGRFLYGPKIEEYLRKLDQPGYGEQHLYRDYLACAHPNGGPALLMPSVYAHGTHVLDIARGAAAGQDDTAIFAIQLPRPAVAQTHGYNLGGHLASALWGVAVHTLLIWSLQGGIKPEVQVNISVGGHANRHDGRSFVEQFFETMLRSYAPVGKIIDAIWLPAGNSYETRTHKKFKSQDTNTAPEEMRWRALPDDGTANFLEIWLPEVADQRPVTLTITPPGRKPFELGLDPKTIGQVWSLKDEKGVVYGRVYDELVQGWTLIKRDGPVRRRILIALRHTQPNRVAQGKYVGGSLETAGDWQVAIKTQDLPEDRWVNAWIARDAEILRYNSGARQSFFPRYRDPAEPAKTLEQAVTDGTISDLATGDSTCVLAAHFASNGLAAPYSSEGSDAHSSEPARDFYPTASAPAEESTARPGLLAAGFFSGSSWRQGGTSVSCPLAMRYIADQPDPFVPASIKEKLSLSAQASEIATMQGPLEAKLKKRFGAGRLNADPTLPGYPPRR